jgi:hypothetical protein
MELLIKDTYHAFRPHRTNAKHQKSLVKILYSFFMPVMSEKKNDLKGFPFEYAF